MTTIQTKDAFNIEKNQEESKTYGRNKATDPTDRNISGPDLALALVMYIHQPLRQISKILCVFLNLGN